MKTVSNSKPLLNLTNPFKIKKSVEIVEITQDSIENQELQVNANENKNSFYDEKTIANVEELKELLHLYSTKGLLKEIKKQKKGPYMQMYYKMYSSQRKFRKIIAKDISVSLKIPPSNRFISRKKVLVIGLNKVLKYNDKEGGETCFRPHVHSFLRKMKQYFTLILFTTEPREKAERYLKILDPHDEYFKARLYKEDCLVMNREIIIKDLRIFSNIPEEDIIILDHDPTSALLQPFNLLPILPFNGGKHDNELLKTSIILEEIFKLSRPFEFLKNQFFKKEFGRFGSFKELLYHVRNSRKIE